MKPLVNHHSKQGTSRSGRGGATNPDPAYAQHATLSPIIGAMHRAVEDEALLRRIFAAMGPHAFTGTPQDMKEWEACLDALRERFGFDDGE